VERRSDADKLASIRCRRDESHRRGRRSLERLVDLFKQAHGWAPASGCEAYQWGAKMEDAALTAMGFEGRAGLQYNYDLCRMVEYGPCAKDSLN
jgi:hypothetical protein